MHKDIELEDVKYQQSKTLSGERFYEHFLESAVQKRNILLKEGKSILGRRCKKNEDAEDESGNRLTVN
jgi:hypothetical protein